MWLLVSGWPGNKAQAYIRAKKMTLWVKALAMQAWWPEFIATNIKWEKNRLHNLSSHLHVCAVACTPTHKHMHIPDSNKGKNYFALFWWKRVLIQVLNLTILQPCLLKKVHMKYCLVFHSTIKIPWIKHLLSEIFPSLIWIFLKWSSLHS